MPKTFSIDARLILQLGRDSIKNHTTALIELVKNSYDADATKIVVEIQQDYIRITDNGFGMTEKEIDKNWLTIGFSEKRKSKKSQIGRRKTGEKGIGRIATDRLGQILRLTTQSEEDSIQSLEINWDDFDVENKPISSIEIKEIKNSSFNHVSQNKDGKTSGTELLIKELREEWDEEDIIELTEELAYFISPLENTYEKKFEIEIKSFLDKNHSKKITPAIYDMAEVELVGEFDGEKTVEFTLSNIHSEKKEKVTLNLKELFQNIKIEKENYEENLECGPFSFDLKLYVQKTDILSGTGITLKELRTFLNNNSGIKIFRDGIVVKPYGFPKSTLGFDWLNLAEKKARNPAGVGRSSYSVTPNQLIGSLKVNRDSNPNIKDSASREGLVENDAFQDFKNIILGGINVLESYRVKIAKKNNPKKKSKSSTDRINTITKELGEVSQELNKIQKNLEKIDDYKGHPLTQTINKVGHAIEETEKTFEELLDEKRTLSALATLGISSAVFGHETETAINDLKSSARNSLEYSSYDTQVAKDELEKLYQTAKLVAGWGAFALTRVEKEKRKKRKRDLSKIINDALNQIQPALDAKNIILNRNLETVYATTYTMDIESIVLNLMTNAYTFCSYKNRVRKINIVLEKKLKKTNLGYLITVGDSGMGVPKEYEHRIFSPLFSTKTGGKENKNGTGLGLTIVQSIVEEMDGEITVGKDQELKGAKFSIWLPNNIK